MTKTYTLEEQKANRKLWVEALRSGEYRQTHGTLTRNGAYCCLGVACRLAGMDDSDICNHDNLHLLGEVRDFFGLCEADGDYQFSSLAKDNDDGKPFAKIASIIESEPAGLFARTCRTMPASRPSCRTTTASSWRRLMSPPRPTPI